MPSIVSGSFLPWCSREFMLLYDKVSLEGVRNRRSLITQGDRKLIICSMANNEYRSMAFVLDGLSIKAIEKTIVLFDGK